MERELQHAPSPDGQDDINQMRASLPERERETERGRQRGAERETERGRQCGAVRETGSAGR